MKIICVIGMGRSGTSLLAQILMRLGVYFGEPDELIGVTPQNERGQFEHKAISNILQGALCANGIDWWLTEKTVRSGWYSTMGAIEARRTIADQIRDLQLSADTASGETRIGIKDSRATLLLPLVDSVIKQPGCDIIPGTKSPAWAQSKPNHVVYLRCLRDPHAVAASVAQAAISGTAPTQRECFGIWANYYTAAREVSCLDVWFEDWFSDPGVQLARVNSYIGGDLSFDANKQAALDVIDPELRHHE